jgi:cytochrome c556
MNKTLFAVALAVASTASYAQMKPEDAIQTRQAGYKFMAWNMGKIKAQVEAPETFNKDQVVAAAKAIAGIATSGMGALYLPGTDKEVNGVPTKAKPELFADLSSGAVKVKKFAGDLVKESAELVKVAEGGDAAAVKAQFGKLNGTCKSCHDDFKMK